METAPTMEGIVTDTVATFRRHVDALSGMQYRRSTGRLTGRNAASTDAGIDAHYKAAAALLKADAATGDAPLCAYLDAHPRYAAKWDKAERRYFGLSV